MARRGAARPRRLSPPALAAKRVQEWFDNIVSTADALATSDFESEVLLGNAFIEVQEILRREHDEAHGPPEPTSVAVVDGMMAREAGYLIGVQVGLRLRGAK